MTIMCTTCGASIRRNRAFPSCQADAGFPNVRRAEKTDEIAALEARIHEADVSAEARGAIKALDEFEQAVGGSSAVMNRRLDDLHSWAVSTSPFFASLILKSEMALLQREKMGGTNKEHPPKTR